MRSEQEEGRDRGEGEVGRLRERETGEVTKVEEEA